MSLTCMAGFAQINEQDGDSIVPRGDAKYDVGVYYRVTSLSYTTAEVAGFLDGKPREALDIPATFEDSISGRMYSVTSVAPEAFKGQTALKSVKLPTTVTRIGKGAFEGCSIEDAVIPGSVYHVEENAYADNPLKQIHIYAPGTDGSPAYDHSVELQHHAFGSEDGTLTDVYVTYKNPPLIDAAADPFPQEVKHPKSAMIHLVDGADEDAYKAAHGWSDFYRDDTTGVEGVAVAADGTREYYTTAGVKVMPENMRAGLYIEKSSTGVRKVVVR